MSSGQVSLSAHLHYPLFNATIKLISEVIKLIRAVIRSKSTAGLLFFFFFLLITLTSFLILAYQIRGTSSILCMYLFKMISPLEKALPDIESGMRLRFSFTISVYHKSCSFLFVLVSWLRFANHPTVCFQSIHSKLSNVSLGVV